MKRSSMQIQGIFRKEKGSITIFLSGVLILMLYASGVLYDFGNLETARADVQEALALASHNALSTFDDQIAREFGLFAISDFNEAKTRAQESLESVFSDGDWTNINSLGFDLQPVERERLSVPEVCRGQIDRFMEWQAPSMMLQRILSTLPVLQSLQKGLSAWKEKTDFEKCLQKVQDTCNEVAGFFEGLESNSLVRITRSEESIPVVEGILPIRDKYVRLKDLFYELENYTISILQKQAGDTAPPQDIQASELLNEEAKGRIRERFDAARELFCETQKDLELLRQKKESILRSSEAIRTQISEAASAQEKWRSSLEKLPPGAMENALRAEYHAQTQNLNPEAVSDLIEETNQMLEPVSAWEKAWKGLQWEGEDVQALSFEGWYAKTMGKAEISNGRWTIPASHWSSPDPFATEKEKCFSEKAVKAQKRIRLSTPQKRSGLGDFLDAWNQRRKAIANAKHAEKLQLENLKGGILDRIGTESWQRYEQDQKSESGSIGLWMPEAGETEAMISQSQKLLATADPFLKEADSSGVQSRLYDQIKLFLYWNGMFSNRLTPLRDQENGEKKSLTGLSFKERPIYGGELEYLIQGKNQWIDNIRAMQYQISGIRFLANLAYAMTSSEINAETSALAVALAGWTGFGAPLVKSALVALVAAGETKLDWEDLIQGKKVALWKSPQTWRFAVSGIRTLASESVHDVFQYVGEEAESGVQAMHETVSDTLDQMQEQIQSSIMDRVRNTLRDWMYSSVFSMESLTEEQLSDQFHKLWASFAGEKGAIAKATKSVISNLQNQKSGILDTIRELGKTAGETETKKISAAIEEALDRSLSGAKERISSFIQSGIESSGNEIQNLLDQGEKATQEHMNRWLDRISEGVGKGSGAQQAIGANIALNYEDYLRILLALQMAAGQEASLLSRTVRLIDAESGDADLSIAPTRILIHQKFAVQTPFFSAWPQMLGSNDSVPALRFSKKWEQGYVDRETKKQ